MKTQRPFTYLGKLSSALAMLMLLLGASTPAYAQTVAATIAVGDFPTCVAMNEKTNRIYVAEGSSTISVIDVRPTSSWTPSRSGTFRLAWR